MAREEVIASSTAQRGTATGGTGASPVLIWTTPQRKTLLSLVILLVVILLIRFILDRRYVPDPQPIEPARMNELADRLDPNTASVADLTVLPQLGQKRAAEIVAFRDEFRRHHPGDVAFKRIEDLFQIKGVGPSMIETLRPHLTFPSPMSHPTTQVDR